MSVRSGGRKVSFNLLADDTAGDELDALSSRHLPDRPLDDGGVSPRRKRRPRSSKKKKNKELGLGLGVVQEERRSAVEDGMLEASRAIHVSHGELRQRNVYGVGSADSSAESSTERKKEELGKSLEERRSVVETVCESLTVVENDELEGSRVSHVSHVELRQRNVNGTAAEAPAPDERSVEKSSSEKWRPEANGAVTRLETMGSLDWKRVIADHPDLREASSMERSPLKYFMGEIYGGNSLRSTISVGNEKKRQRVYNTMFHVPLRCERLIIAGFFFCLDSFLSLLTIMPARILMTIGRFLRTRQFMRPSAAELSDFGCFIVLAFGVTTLQLTDISLIYHIIRGQGTIKLYVVYNVLEIFDKLCQSFGEDVLQVLFSSAEGLANCSAENVTFELLRFIFDEAIAVIAFIVHSFVLLAQAITLSTCIIAHNNALMALLISNNFGEIKSNVFKRVSKENLQNLVYYDIVERFHITAFVLFVLAQNILEAEGPWFESFFMNAMLVYVCELLIDTIKHAFLAKFNEIKPDAYSEFLEDLCKQTLNEKPEERRQDLTFIPVAPACVVIRVLTPIYATLLPFGPLLWRLFWIVFWSSLTYIMLTICKILVGLTLRRLATWYLDQRQERKQHMD